MQKEYKLIRLGPKTLIPNQSINENGSIQITCTIKISTTVQVCAHWDFKGRKPKSLNFQRLAIKVKILEKLQLRTKIWKNCNSVLKRKFSSYK